MKENIKNIIEIITPKIKNDIKTDEKVLTMVHAAFNRWQEDEHDGNDYLFDLTDKADLKYLVEYCDITAVDIYQVMKEITENAGITAYVKWDETSVNKLRPIGTIQDLHRLFIGSLDIMLPIVITYATRCEEYGEIYDRYITEVLEQDINNFGF